MIVLFIDNTFYFVEEIYGLYTSSSAVFNCLHRNRCFSIAVTCPYSNGASEDYSAIGSGWFCPWDCWSPWAMVSTYQQGILICLLSIRKREISVKKLLVKIVTYKLAYHCLKIIWIHWNNLINLMFLNGQFSGFVYYSIYLLFCLLFIYLFKHLHIVRRYINLKYQILFLPISWCVQGCGRFNGREFCESAIVSTITIAYFGSEEMMWLIRLLRMGGHCYNQLAP